MSKYINAAKTLQSMLDNEKPHSSITDWVDILSSDRYDEDSMDGVTELVESIRIQGIEGVTEASRALRKKLKYGNVHRQIRALTILRALTENAGKGFQHNFCNAQLRDRLKEMATDSLTDPRVKRKMISVFHSWSVSFADDPRMREVAGFYAQYSGKKVIRAQPTPKTSLNATTSVPAPTRPSGFEDLEHSWAPAGYTSGSKDKTYADLAAAKEEAEARKREREARAALEAREAEIERRERALKNKETDRQRLEAARAKGADDAVRRRQEEEAARARAKQPKRPPFNFAKEKPQVLVAIANASQAANNLVNACRHVNRERENVTENIKVLEYLEKAKVARRPIIRYIQVVTDEEFVGTLLEANEKIVEAIQLYDRLSKPAALDSDSDHEEAPKKAADDSREMERLHQRMEAQKLEAQRTGELDKMQARQKVESQRASERRGAGGRQQASFLPPPMQPDEAPAEDFGTLSDFSDYDYDSSDNEYQARVQSRSQSRRASAAPGSASHNAAAAAAAQYQSLDEPAAAGGLDPNDPFADPSDFLSSIGGGGSNQPKKERMEWAAI